MLVCHLNISQRCVPTATFSLQTASYWYSNHLRYTTVSHSVAIDENEPKFYEGEEDWMQSEYHFNLSPGLIWINPVRYCLQLIKEKGHFFCNIEWGNPLKAIYSDNLFSGTLHNFYGFFLAVWVKKSSLTTKSLHCSKDRSLPSRIIFVWEHMLMFNISNIFSPMLQASFWLFFLFFFCIKSPCK